MYDILATSYAPELDDNGAVMCQPVRKNTIGWHDIQCRFKLFKLSLSGAAVGAFGELRDARNDVEHLCPPLEEVTLRERVSRSYLVAAELFRLGDLEPSACFFDHDTWPVMLRNIDVHEYELSACLETFEDVVWGVPVSRPPSLRCLFCGSDLMERISLPCPSPDRVVAACRACGQNMVIPTGFRHPFLEDGRLAVLTACPFHSDVAVRYACLGG